MRARRGLRGAWLSAFGQNKQRQQKIGGAKRRGRPSWTRISEILQALAADERSKNETETEGHADKPHLFRPLFGRRDVRDVSLRHRNVASAKPGEHPRQNHQPKSGFMVLHAGTQGEQHVRSCRARSADEQYRATAVAVRKPAPNGGEKKLHRRKRGNDNSDHHPMGAEMGAINRDQRHHNAEADKVNKNRKEDDQNRRSSHEVERRTAPTIATWISNDMP